MSICDKCCGGAVEKNLPASAGDAGGEGPL